MLYLINAFAANLAAHSEIISLLGVDSVAKPAASKLNLRSVER